VTHLEDLDVDGRIITSRWRDAIRIYLAEEILRFCEKVNGILDSTKGAECLNKLRNSFIHKKYSTGYLVSHSVS